MPKDITIKAYTFDELDAKAKEMARSWYRNGDLMEYLPDLMLDALMTALHEAGITYSEKPKVYYSLSYSQGDGACFIGTFYHDGYTFKVTHHGRYYHQNSIEVELLGQTESGDVEPKAGDERDVPTIEAAFLDRCKDICRKLENAGYDEMSYRNSDEAVDESIRANDYLFTVNGSRTVVL